MLKSLSINGIDQRVPKDHEELHNLIDFMICTDLNIPYHEDRMKRAFSWEDYGVQFFSNGSLREFDLMNLKVVRNDTEYDYEICIEKV